MNIFCRLFGHTWVYKSLDAKIRWSAAKNMAEMDQTSDIDGPQAFLECARCAERLTDPSPEQVSRLLA